MTEPDDYTEAMDMAEERLRGLLCPSCGRSSHCSACCCERYCAECGGLTNHTTAQHQAAPRQPEP